jgi:hypothetical protein
MKKKEYRFRDGMAKTIGSLNAWIEIIGDDVKRTEKFHKAVDLTLTKKTIKSMKKHRKSLKRLLKVI